MNEKNIDKITMFNELKKLCDFTEKQINGYQNDTNLINFLESEYPKLSKTSIKNILKYVKGKKELIKIIGEERKELENKLIAESFLNDVNPIGKNGKFIGYSKLKHRIASKKMNYGNSDE